eukprot:m.14857 g.14857  ORF g.14857 m.14857 type:complete len:157 (+) comp8474_c0_seq1:2309-2779(+)
MTHDGTSPCGHLGLAARPLGMLNLSRNSRGKSAFGWICLPLLFWKSLISNCRDACSTGGRVVMTGREAKSGGLITGNVDPQQLPMVGWLRKLNLALSVTELRLVARLASVAEGACAFLEIVDHLRRPHTVKHPVSVGHCQPTQAPLRHSLSKNEYS